MASSADYGRPRTHNRVLSFGSNRSSGSGGHKFTKEELVETPRDKAAKRMSTKANPNTAMNEVEPTVQATMQPTMNSNLRVMQFKDMFGNPITDPDLSNPTRPRLERPLDTIRSFEAAIDGKYGRVSSYPETPGPSRPASSYFGLASNQSYSGGRSGRPDSYIDSQMYGSANRRSPAPFGGSQRRFGPQHRNQSDPMMYGNGMYSQSRHQPYQQSYDSVGSSGGSGGTENWNPPSTDPSTPNSSVDQFRSAPPPAPPKHDTGEQYGFTGFGGVPQTELEYAQSQAQTGYQGQQNGYQSQNPHNPYQANDAPPPPPHKAYAPRTTSYSQQPQQQSRDLQKKPLHNQHTPRAESGDRRKSWLMRRFSKNS